MQTLDDAMALLNARGVRASRRQWALGDTLVVTHAHGETAGGIEVFSLALYIVWTDGIWEVVSCAHSGPASVTQCGSLDEACGIVTTELLAAPTRG